MNRIEKNLATCTPTEFVVQTNRMRKCVEKWLTVTDIQNIRKKMPQVSPTATKEEKTAALKAQMRSNLTAILDAILEDHPKETLEMLALLCFVEPEHVDDYPMSQYLRAFADVISNEDVINFILSLVRLDQTGILR